VKDRSGDALGQRFQQVEARTGDRGGHRASNRSVVDGVGQIVGTPGPAQVHLQVDVNLEGLGPLPFLRQDPVDPERPQSSQLNAIRWIDTRRRNVGHSVTQLRAADR
jgi:hypothetical protein